MLGFKVVLKKWRWARRTLAQVAADVVSLQEAVLVITTTLGVIMDQLTELQAKADAAQAAEMAALDRIAAHEAAEDAAIALLNEQKAALEATVADLRTQLEAATVDPAAVAAIADKLDSVVAGLAGIDPAPVA